MANEKSAVEKVLSGVDDALGTTEPEEEDTTVPEAALTEDEATPEAEVEEPEKEQPKRKGVGFNEDVGLFG